MSFCPKTDKAGIWSQGFSKELGSGCVEGRSVWLCFVRRCRDMEGKDGFRICYSGKERKFVSETDVKHLRVIKLQVKVFLCKPSSMAPGKIDQWKLLYLGN